MGIDVVVCAKNSENTMENMLRQIRREIPVENLIIIYGTSFDHTKEISLKYTDKVYWDEDKGLGAARNLGIRKSASEIVAMIDTDVILPKKWYQNLVRHFKNDKIAAAVGTCIYGYGCTPIQKYYEYNSIHHKEGEWGTHNVLFRRNAILKIGNFNKQINGAGEDYDIYKRLIKAGFEWKWDKEVIVYHPITIFQHLKHNIWWAKGITSLKSEKLFSIHQLLGCFLNILKRGIKYSNLHFFLLFYVPFIDLIWLFIDFRSRSLKQKIRA
jgi:cellulose synthase/poly-beta-1,6-N-acetylglucosamine synthase-like glycosyltransferase